MKEGTREGFADEVFKEFLAQNSSTIQNSILMIQKICLIQAFTRGYLVHRRYCIVNESAIVIQKNYLRKRAVTETNKLFDAAMYLRRKDFFDNHATVIQAAFRGFYARKYILDASQRRKYIAAVATVSANLAEEAREFSKKCAAEKVAEENQRKAAYIKSLAHQHHLRSTKAIPGVYKPQFPMSPQTIDGRPIDDIIKAEGLAVAKKATYSVTRSRTSKFPLLSSAPSAPKNSSSLASGATNLLSPVPAPLSGLSNRT